MKKRVTIFNFDHIYEQEKFYKNLSYQWIDMTDMTGVNGYLDDESMKVIRTRLKDHDHTYFNFIDSGNYHYMTYLLLEQIKEPFTLVLFDHHTDMMPSRFGNLMSCGCWVKRSLDENPYLKQVILVGVADQLLSTLDKQYQDRLCIYSQRQVETDDSWQLKLLNQIENPVYISVDKDVIDEEEAKTNWDQGSLTLFQLRGMLNQIHKEKKIIGIDVCGELTEGSLRSKASIINDKANNEIVHMV